MMIQNSPPPGAYAPDILLVEHSALIGNIFVSTARQLGLPPIKLVTSSRSARNFMESQCVAGLITSLDDEEAALMLIEKLRDGQFKSQKNTPVAITTGQCSAELANRLKIFNVRRILLKPFKIRDLVATIEILARAP
jgi:DNA-binding response OmpR family regulator